MRHDVQVTQLIVVAVLAAFVALWLAARIRRWRATLRAKRRAARAGAGEDLAAEILHSAGYQIVERQARTTWIPLIDGEPCELELRADYLVEADGELFVAEVKTGNEAISITTAATRRQLLEYSIAFEVDGVLLVCPERNAIHLVEFRATRIAN